MPVYVSGYFLSLANTRAIVDRLQIPDKGVEDDRLESPINDWLAKQGRKQPLAGAINNRESAHPLDHGVNGMLFMTHFIVDRDVSDITYEEGKLDKAVKEWLIKEAGVKEEDLIWYSRWDRFDLTRNGFVPYLNDIHGPRKKIINFTADQHERWRKSGKTLSAFVEEDLAREHANIMT